MKKTLLAVLLLALTIFACTTAMAADKFSFEQAKVTVFEGETIEVPLVRDGKYAEDGLLTYTVTSGGRYLSVADDGTITGIQKGEGTVYCTLKLDNGTTKKCYTTVKVARKATVVEMNTQKMNIYDPDDARVLELLKQDTTYPTLVLPIGKTLTLNAQVLPEDASNRRAAFESTDTAVALIQSGNTLKTTKVGECDLRVYSVQNPEVEEWFHVLVVQPVTKITVTGENRIVLVGSQVMMEAQCQPSNATMKEVLWSSESPAVATVDEYGMVTGIKRGSTVIRATAADGSGKYGTFNINVQQGPESISLKNAYEVVDVGASRRLVATVLPSTVNNQNVSWSSSDNRIATVTKNGTVKGVSVGHCTLTCVSEADSNVYATVTVEVQQPVTKVTFDQSNVSVDAGSSIMLSWTTAPATASNPGVVLKSANERIATVDQNGRVTGVKKGTVRITATSTDGSNKSASVNVKVTQPVEGVYFRQDIYHVPFGEFLSLHSWTRPNDADNQHMTWYTEDAYVATVNKGYTTTNSNSIYGRRLGTTTLYCTTEDGGFTASAAVVVDRYNDPLEVRDLYLNSNRIKMNLTNISGMNLTRFNFTIEAYDVYGKPMVISSDGTNLISGYYMDPLGPGETTTHGRFYFNNFIQPTQTIGGLIMKITGYRTDETYINDDKPTYYYKNFSGDNQLETRYPSDFEPAPIVIETPDPEIDGGVG